MVQNALRLIPGTWACAEVSRLQGAPGMLGGFGHSLSQFLSKSPELMIMWPYNPQGDKKVCPQSYQSCFQ